MLEVLRFVTGKSAQSLLTPEEKQFKLEQALGKWPKVTNPNLWLAFLQKATSRKSTNGLWESELTSMLDAYQLTRVQGEVTIAELAFIASEGSCDLLKDPLLARTCFNYDELGVRGLIGRVNEEFTDLMRFAGVSDETRFNSITQASERVFSTKRMYLDHEDSLGFLRHTFKEGVIPLLEQDEIVKAGVEFEFYYQDAKPVVIKRNVSAEPTT